MPEEIEVPALPKVKVIQNGKPVDTSAIDNYDEFMSFLMQASMAANIAGIKRYYDDRKSDGEVQTLELNVTPTTIEIPVTPSQSLYIENNGPGQIFVSLNSGRYSTPIPATRAAIFPFENHAIERFYIWSAAGTVATAVAILKS
jgi:hypothetical protein